MISIIDIFNDFSRPEIYDLKIGQAYSILNDSNINLFIGLEGKIASWNLKSFSVDRYFNHYNLIGKVFYLQKFNEKENIPKVLSCDALSIKIWNQYDFMKLKEIEYPQANLFSQLTLDQRIILSFDKILTITKITENKIIIFNQTLKSLSLLNIETGEYIVDSKTYEKIDDTLYTSPKIIFSTQIFGRLVSFHNGIVTLYELDDNIINQGLYNAKNNSLNNRSNFEAMFGKVFLKKIYEINLVKMNVIDLVYLHDSYLLTINIEYNVNFLDLLK